MQSRITLEQGEVLYKHGDESVSAYLVVSGELEETTIKNGEVEKLGKVMPWELLGEMSVINNSPRTTIVTATKPTVIVLIDKEQILDRLEKSDPIIRSLVTTYARRFLNSFNKDFDASKAKSDRDIGQHSIDKIKFEHSLVKAIKEKTLDVLYQPILDVATDEIVGYEALLRWNHPEQGPISPNVIISMAQETTLIDEISEYVINFACDALNKILPLNQSSTKPFISINITPAQLCNRDFITSMIGKIELAKLPKYSLKLETTGSYTLFNDDTKEMIDFCHDNGVKVALDNFGYGESNLSLTHNLKFDTLNIDRSFTTDIQRNPRSMALVDMIVNMGYKLKSDVLIAGIESEEMLDFARELNCRYAQGYYISKPQTLSHIMEQVSNGKNDIDAY